ncbi:hypothetical protein [Pandoraea sputorum]|uniref:DUF2474 domain-containing protein n=1 Tax=Pandoraea sputorum TaxID=93222 RepID=A0A239SET1_9BURK|nr:hypothetical protein [Pandoraea sputorum]SNU83759.1 Uncharacterised protein [Pandoraea sputorum]VVD95442.1 hypothetical protein PSP20601_01847 [Pandoraea sputorum]VVE77221.1 hypothetical protein PSP31120_01130 [Pandoraea sputorum]
MRTITDLVRPGVRRRRETSAALSPRLPNVRTSWQQRLTGWGWFIALWCAGVAGTALLALPFKLIIATAK